MRTSVCVFAMVVAASVVSCSPKKADRKAITGLVDATEVDVASKIPGRIKEVYVKEGDAIKEGQKLLTIESEEMKAKIDQVNATIDAAQAKLKLAQSGGRKEERDAVANELEAAKHQVDIAKKNHDRVTQLLAQSAIAQSQFDEADFRYKVAQDQLAMVQAKHSIVTRGARAEELDALRALVRQGQGTLAEVESYQKETTQTSPISGEVSKLVLHRGELAATGYPILSIVDLNDIWATFAMREDLLQRVRKGAELRVEIPALGREETMEVFNIASMGDFATWRATSEKNSFDLKSFEVKLRPKQKIEGLRPGMTVRWYLDG